MQYIMETAFPIIWDLYFYQCSPKLHFPLFFNYVALLKHIQFQISDNSKNFFRCIATKPGAHYLTAGELWDLKFTDLNVTRFEKHQSRCLQPRYDMTGLPYFCSLKSFMKMLMGTSSRNKLVALHWTPYYSRFVPIWFLKHNDYSVHSVMVS